MSTNIVTAAHPASSAGLRSFSHPVAPSSNSNVGNVLPVASTATRGPSGPPPVKRKKKKTKEDDSAKLLSQLVGLFTSSGWLPPVDLSYAPAVGATAAPAVLGAPPGEKAVSSRPGSLSMLLCWNLFHAHLLVLQPLWVLPLVRNLFPPFG